MRCVCLIASLLAAPLASAQIAQGLQEAQFLRVAIDGTLNLRQAPSTEAGRVKQLDNRTLLRRLDCETYADEAWCEVETLDGGTEGWAAAAFLRAYLGADPAALTSPSVGATQSYRADAGRIEASIEPASIHDYLVSVSAGEILEVVPNLLPEGTRVALFGADGALLAQIGADGDRAEIEFGVTGDTLVRLVETEGAGGAYRFDIILR